MELIGTIKQVNEPINGTSKAGNAYTTQVVVISYGDGQYERELALTLMTKQVEKYGNHLRQGQTLKFFFDATSREYNGRWYTECTVWKIESLNNQPQQPTPMAAPQQPTTIPNYAPQPSAPQASPQPQPPTEWANDLPF